MEKELPKGWTISTVDDCFDILDNQRVPLNSDERASKKGNIPYYGATGQIDSISEYIFDEELILLGEDAAPFFDKSKNVAYLISGKSWVNNHAHVLKARKEISLNKFALYFFNQFDYNGFVGGSTRLKLTQGSLKLIPYLLPPLNEQKRIADKLDEIFGHLDRVKERLDKIPELLKQFRQSVLTQAVTGKLTEEWRKGKKLENWKSYSISELILSIEAGKNFSCPEIPVSKGKVGLVKISAVTWGTFDVTQTKTVQNTESINPKLFIKKGDFLISRANTIELVGSPVIVEEIRYDVMLSDKVWRVNFKNEHTKAFVRYFLTSRIGRNQIESKAVGNQMSMRNISQENFKSINLDLPEIVEQKEILKQIESLFSIADQIEEYYNNLKNKIETLPQSILAKAFSGELVEQDK